MTTQMTLPGLVPQWTLGDRLRKAREIAGLNQDEFSQEIGIARNSVRAYEKGKTAPPRPVMIAWAFRTGVALDWLAKGEPPDEGGTNRTTWSPIPGNMRDDDGPPSTAELADVKGALRKRIPLTPPIREPQMRQAVAL